MNSSSPHTSGRKQSVGFSSQPAKLEQTTSTRIIEYCCCLNYKLVITPHFLKKAMRWRFVAAREPSKTNYQYASMGRISSNVENCRERRISSNVENYAERRRRTVTKCVPSKMAGTPLRRMDSKNRDFFKTSLSRVVCVDEKVLKLENITHNTRVSEFYETTDSAPKTP